MIQDSYGGLVSDDSQTEQTNLKTSQPKSEQKFRSQTQESNINRNRGRLNQNQGSHSNEVSSKLSARAVNVKQKAVR